MVIDFLLFSFLVTMARASFRLLEHVKFRGEERDRQALIYGAGRGGGLTLRECLQNRRLGLMPVGFVDDDPRKLGKSFNGYPVMGTREEIPALLDKYRIDTILLSSPDIPPERVAWLQEVSETKGVEGTGPGAAALRGKAQSNPWTAWGRYPWDLQSPCPFPLAGVRYPNEVVCIIARWPIE